MEAKEILTIILSSAGFSALVSAVVSAIANAIQRKQDKREKDDEKAEIRNKAISQILLRQVQTFGEEILTEEAVTSEEYKQFEEMFNTYKALGGNGYADKLHDEIKRRPLMREE